MHLSVGNCTTLVQMHANDRDCAQKNGSSKVEPTPTTPSKEAKVQHEEQDGEYGGEEQDGEYGGCG